MLVRRPAPVYCVGERRLAMNIPLKKPYADWIAEQVSAGRYASEIEAVEDALAG